MEMVTLQVQICKWHFTLRISAITWNNKYCIFLDYKMQPQRVKVCEKSHHIKQTYSYGYIVY